MSVAESADVLQKDPDQSSSESTGLEHVATLATERVGGMSQLLAVSGCRVRGFEPAWGLAVEGGPWTDRITLDSMGFVPRQDRTAAFGVGFGFWGTLAVTDSVPMVFAFTILLLMLPLLTEAAFSAIGRQTMGHVVAALMSLMLWGQPTFFDMSRFFFIVILTFVVVVLLAKRAPSEGDKSDLPQDDEHVGSEGRQRL
jgi:hypothetical protein